MSWWKNLFSGRPATPVPAEPIPLPPAVIDESAKPGLPPERPLAELQGLIRSFARPAWLPLTVDADHGALASKFGGLGLVSASHPGPVCPGCQQPMPLFVQLNPADLPAEMAPRLQGQLLQLYYCPNECDDGFLPFSSSSVVRLVPPAEPPAAGAVAESLPAKTIVGWRAVADYPHWEEWPTIGLTLTLDEGVRLEQESAEPLLPAHQDKLGGWPHWVQAPDYPACPECHEPMQVLFQLTSEEHLPYMFGDVGTGHISQCARHLPVLAFGWACH